MENAPVVQEFIELAELDAASRKERLVVDAVTRKLSDMGFTVRENDTAEKVGGEAGNVCAYLEGSAKGSVLFAAHLDRVNNGLGIKPQFKDGCLVSDGTTVLAADDLSGVSAILAEMQSQIDAFWMVCGGLSHPANPARKLRSCSRSVRRSAYREPSIWMPRCLNQNTALFWIHPVGSDVFWIPRWARQSCSWR